jgi:hypothetical protein
VAEREEPGAHLELSGDQAPKSSTAHIELSGDARSRAGGEGWIELRGGDVVVHAPAITATVAAIAGEVTITATGEVKAGDRTVPLRGAVQALVLADVIRHVLEVAEDPSRKAEVNLAVSMLIAVLLVVLGAGSE